MEPSPILWAILFVVTLLIIAIFWTFVLEHIYREKDIDLDSDSDIDE